MKGRAAWGRRGLIGIACLAIATLAPQPVLAETERQHKLEAAFLYNFFNYITWPGYTDPDQMREATICVQEGDPTRHYLEYVQRKMAAKRRLTIRNWRSGQSTGGCHLLFTRNRANSVDDPATVTISDRLREGAALALEEEGGRISISIDQRTLQSRGFRISSRLLALAKEIR